MRKNYTVLFLMLFSAFIAGGLGLQNFFDSAMIIGVSLGTVCLFCAIYFAGRSQKTQ
ncbi:hypothetical protein [Bacillales bacterium]|uniref:hypothetical protein n=1 Tax=Exiguobacterium sp. S22-S28 TaxID=3342768 RepID=UPI00142E9EED